MKKDQLSDIEFERGEEERGSITYASMIMFKYNGTYYESEVYVTYSWEQDKESEYSFFYPYVDDKLLKDWDEIEQRLNEEIIRWNESRR